MEICERVLRSIREFNSPGNIDSERGVGTKLASSRMDRKDSVLVPWCATMMAFKLGE